MEKRITTTLDGETVEDKTVKLTEDQIDAITGYIESHGIEIYIDYRDELGEKQVEAVLEGKADEVRDEIEMEAYHYEDYSYYWDDLCTDLDITKEQLDLWLESEHGFYPSHYLSDSGWRQLLGNTSVNIVGIMWGCEWNFYNWAYSGPVEYSDVKEALKVLGVNPKVFHDKLRGGSMTSGQGKLRGWFPDMPQRVPSVDVDELYDNMCSLYNGVMHFCFGDLENLAAILSDDSKNLVIKKGTNVVMYDRMNGAGITEVQLTNDVTIRRKDIEFRNDSDRSNGYGVQACYGFTSSYWNEGSIQSGK